jgi:hypothetical protein
VLDSLFFLAWRRTCLLRWNFRTNDCPHKSHENGLSPLCDRRCTFRVLESKNVKKQTLQVNGLSPECTRLCKARLAFCLNDLLHTVHVCGRSPVCTVLCTLRLPTLAKVLLQNLHSYGRNNECSSAVCLLRWYFRMKDLLHILHTCSRTKLLPSCFVAICLFRWPAWTYDLLHMMHVYEASWMSVGSILLGTWGNGSSSSTPSSP